MVCRYILACARSDQRSSRRSQVQEQYRRRWPARTMVLHWSDSHSSSAASVECELCPLVYRAKNSISASELVNSPQALGGYWASCPRISVTDPSIYSIAPPVNHLACQTTVNHTYVRTLSLTDYVQVHVRGRIVSYYCLHVLFTVNHWTLHN